MPDRDWVQLYNADDNSKLRKLQLVELNVIKVFSEICEKHKLKYILCGGTILGAIRHKGFIPWDDDLDVAMPRPDYDKLALIAQEELKGRYRFLSYKTDETYHRNFNRIVDTKVIVHNNSNNVELLECAWIDIFPLDGMSNGKLRRWIHFGSLTFKRFLYHSSCFDEMVNLNRPGRPWFQQFIIKFLEKTHFGSKLDTKELMIQIEHGLKKYDYNNGDWIVSFFGSYMTKEVFEKRLIGEGTKYQFEDLMLYGPDLYDEFLRHFYGDYMKVPADAHKDKHNITEIEYLDEVQ